jgi:excisionase family DNA binding protein
MTASTRALDDGGIEPRNAVGVPLAVSPRKAAKYLDVGHDAIYQLLNQGRLRSVKLGRRRLIPMTELERFLDEELA